ncbi:MAG: glutamine amidotransferase, partial [Planctomycetaceae bacterium]
FDKADPDTVEEYDEAVLIRLNVAENELQGGFPQKAEELFQYDAVILDDLEADFFLADQMKLLYDFVSQRGGGLLMMSGQESFAQGDYNRTPIGELLPIDLERRAQFPTTPVEET